ncbi:TonB-dependent receptor [Parasphingorhabdus litoris]|uniref:TonB-dependent receptor n=2 Tax=Parasphingorhabdus litoris TaxID=394733 RepID=A0ABN1AQT8_9SPHN
MQAKTKIPLAFLLVTTSLSSVGSEVYAQGGEQVNSDDIIIVTARGREESLIEAPLSTTVFSGEDIEAAGIDRVDDFLGLTPGVSIANSQDSGTNFITIRGVSQTRNGQPPVAVLIDGVLQVNSRSFDQPLYEVESIEVLRGPQGALYGRNATNGAIIINTKDPSDEFSGYVKGGYGSGEEYSVEGSVSGPLVEDMLGLRVSGRYYSRDGYFTNVVLDDEVGFYDEFNVKGHLRFTPSDELTIDLRATHTENDGDALNYTFQGVTTDPVTGEVIGFASLADANAVQRRFSANNRGFDDRKVSQISLLINYDLGFGNLSSATAWDKLRQSIGGDQFPYSANTTVNPGISFSDGTQTQFVDVEAVSQEIRLTSYDDSALRWMVGGYYLNINRFISSSTGDDLGLGVLPVLRVPFLGNAVNPTNGFIADDNDDRAWALFFNAAYDVTDQLEIAVAGRYDEDRRKQTVSLQNGFFDAAGNLLAPQGTPGAVNRRTFSRFQPKVSARYLATDDFSIYASWGRGFRSGQFNQNGVAAAAAGAGLVGVTDIYDQENTETLEAGLKFNLPGRLTISAGAYHTTVENAPYFVFVGAVGAQILVGIDEVEIHGGELELSANLADGLDLDLGLAISDSEIKDYSLDPTLVGNKAPYVPNASFNAGLQYRTAIAGSVGFFGRMDYEVRGRQFWDPENSTARRSLDLVGLRAGIEDVNGKWSLIGSVENVNDLAYNSEYVTGGFAHAASPRIWRIEGRINF